MTTNSYTAKHIEVLTGLEPVQKRPGMYTDTTCPNHLAQEAIDNSVDEALAGFATEIDVVLHEDNSIEVTDNGRGMPVDIHPEEGISGVELIFTKLHAGGKFSNKLYQFAGGLHGVGISVVNALSEYLTVGVKRDGKKHHMSFAFGAKTEDLKVIDSVGKKNTGTSIRFWPDAKYFTSNKINIKRLIHTLRAKAILCSNLAITLHDKMHDKKYSWQYQDGIKQYLEESVQGEEILLQQPFCGEVQNSDHAVSWATTWCVDSHNLINESYVNLIPTPLGGTHINGFRNGLLEALKEFCRLRNLLSRTVKITADDILQRAGFVLSVKLKEPQFSGQTKERLSSRECSSLVGNIMKDAFSLWLHKHVDEGEKIVELIVKCAEARRRSEKKIQRKSYTSSLTLPGKLTDCSSENAKETELFLVEGDSAGGSAKQARFRKTQAVMPLRGKILNTWDVSNDVVISCQVVADISTAIGVMPMSDISGLRYNKICILADADSDGSHIATLLCCLFFKHFPELVANGHIYVALPPLYRIDAGKNTIYAKDDEEKEAFIKSMKAKNPRIKINVIRFKGLGEMNPLQLRETTMHPDTRRLIQLTVEDETLADTNNIMAMLLSKKQIIARRAWISSNSNIV